MTGRHAAAVDVDDEALAEKPQEPGAHRADIDPVADPVPVPVKAQAKPAGRRATKKESP